MRCGRANHGNPAGEKPELPARATVPSTGRLRQEGHWVFKASLEAIVRPTSAKLTTVDDPTDTISTK